MVMYLGEVVIIINQVFGTRLSNITLSCVLGYLDAADIATYTTLAVTKSLFAACRMILLRWDSDTPSSVRDWTAAPSLSPMNNYL